MTDGGSVAESVDDGFATFGDAPERRQAEGHGSDPRERIERWIADRGREVAPSADILSIALREVMRDRMLERNLVGRPGTLLVRNCGVLPRRTLNWGLWLLCWESSELLRGPDAQGLDEGHTWWPEEDWTERGVLDTYAYGVHEKRGWPLYTVCAREGARIPKSVEAFADCDVDLRTVVEPRHLAKSVGHRFTDALGCSWRDAWAERTVALLRSSYARPWVQLLDVAAAQALSFAQMAERFDDLVERAGGTPVGGGYSWFSAALERGERREVDDFFDHFDFGSVLLPDGFEPLPDPAPVED